MKAKKKKKSLRPTSNKVREAFFHIVRDEIHKSSFLDLYAGTGAIGIEALRKGATEVVFVEASRASAGTIESTLKRVRPVGKASIIRKKAVPFIHWAESQGLSFHIIFLDPPYHTDDVIHALTAIDKSGILKKDGIVIAEHFIKRHLPGRFDKLEKIKDYKYGDTVLSFYAAPARGEDPVESGICGPGEGVSPELEGSGNSLIREGGVSEKDRDLSGHV